MGNSIQHQFHAHPLDLIKIESINTHSASCRGCNGPFKSRNLYGCLKCEYFLHRLCAQMEYEIAHNTHKDHKLVLLPTPAYQGGAFLCNICNGLGTGFSYHCNQCSFDLHTFCANLPKLHTELHEHTLRPCKDRNFLCRVCGNNGKKFLHYSCESCQFHAHPCCLTREISAVQTTKRPSADKTILKIAIRKAAVNIILTGVGEVLDLLGFGDHIIEVGEVLHDIAEAGALAAPSGHKIALEMLWENLQGADEHDREGKILTEIVYLFLSHMRSMDTNQSSACSIL